MTTKRDYAIAALAGVDDARAALDYIGTVNASGVPRPFVQAGTIREDLLRAEDALARVEAKLRQVKDGVSN
jgi:hypothetical protein